MADLKITNRTKSPYIIPLVNSVATMTNTMIMPGDWDVIADDVHEALLKGNQAYQAMIEQRLLVVTNTDKAVDVGTLGNVSTPVPPQDMTDELETPSGKPVVVDNQVELVDLEIDAGPTRATRK